MLRLRLRERCWIEMVLVLRGEDYTTTLQLFLKRTHIVRIVASVSKDLPAGLRAASACWTA